jgi:phosphate starvation-inducible membrane PsiE
MWSISLTSRAAPLKNGAHNIIKINLVFIILIIMFLRQNLYYDSAGDLITYFLHFFFLASLIASADAAAK